MDGSLTEGAVLLDSCQETVWSLAKKTTAVVITEEGMDHWLHTFSNLCFFCKRIKYQWPGRAEESSARHAGIL